MTDSTPAKAQIVLANEGSLGKIHVDMEAFFDLSFWMAEELEDLVAHWQHKAAPRATKPVREQLLKSQ